MTGDGEGNDGAKGCTRTLDQSKPYTKDLVFLDLENEKGKSPPPKEAFNPVTDPWSKLEAPKVKLKPLPTGLKYAFLGPNSTYPIILNSKRNNVETTLLLCKMQTHRKALGYSLEDILRISPDLCMIKIHLEVDTKNSIEHQRRLNLNIMEVVKKEIMKILEAGIVFPISDSTWVSTVHVVSKKGCIMVTKYKNMR